VVEEDVEVTVVVVVEEEEEYENLGYEISRYTNFVHIFISSLLAKSR
jgi:hypothetical protein